MDLTGKGGEKIKLDIFYNPICDRFAVTIRKGGKPGKGTRHYWTATKFAKMLRKWLIAQK